ncbi:MAG: FG-GAP repeat domain-containing protein [Planctomycetota bacterium]|jgi:hypothetical protein
MPSPRATLVALLTLPSLAAAQFGDTWAQFVRDDARISSPSAISDADHETDMAWGDLDKDGDVDLVVVRAVPHIVVGKRSNVLLMNEGGVLVDRTADLAASSDVGGDMGFLTPTQDRDVVLADVDGDGWLDVITAADLWQPGDPKHVTHPRVYINLGDAAEGGGWLGLRHEDSRVPQLMSHGNAIHPRFMTVAAGDVDGDGDTDLFFGDQDFVSQFVDEPTIEDANDRLLINDGAGVFSDGTKPATTQSMVDSTFHNSALFADFNQDGLLDLLQEDGYFDPTTILYNDPRSPGVFAIEDDTVYTGTGYFAGQGDLNGDGRPDIAISDNGLDKFLINTGTDVDGKATWGPVSTFEFLVGGEDGIAANNLVVDLDQDGWDDVLIADVDPEIPGYGRRLHIYHNRGGTVGGTDIVLREERQSALDTDWIGVVGMDASDLSATHDVAVFDVDGDGLLDMVVSQLAGTFVWRGFEPWADAGLGLAGTTGVPLLVGSGSLLTGDAVSLTTSGALGSVAATMFVGFTQIDAPFKGGTLVPGLDVILFGLATDAGGNLALAGTWPPGVPSGTTVWFQTWIADAGGPAGFAASNGVSGTTP